MPLKVYTDSTQFLVETELFCERKQNTRRKSYSFKDQNDKVLTISV